MVRFRAVQPATIVCCDAVGRYKVMAIQAAGLPGICFCQQSKQQASSRRLPGMNQQLVQTANIYPHCKYLQRLSHVNSVCRNAGPSPCPLAHTLAAPADWSERHVHFRLQLQDSLWHSVVKWCKQAVDGSFVHIHIWLTETAVPQ